jgi:hypothetical protein
MKLPLLALLCAATASFCQSAPSTQVEPGKLFQMPDKFSETVPDLRKPAIKQKFSMNSVHPTLHMEVLRPGPKPAGPNLNNPQIDPKIILHPPWPSDGGQPRGQEVSRNLYPNLRFLPIHGPAQAHR